MIGDRPLTGTERCRRYREKHRAYMREYKKKYHRDNLEKQREMSRVRNARYRARHPGRVADHYRKWVQKDPEEAARQARERHRRYWENNLSYRIKSRVRDRVRQALKKQGQFVALRGLVGCTKEELRDHLESRFVEGMTWANWGRDGWHVDHIIPLSSFDLSNEEQLRRAAHFTNLQPLWASENIRKNNKILV